MTEVTLPISYISLGDKRLPSGVAAGFGALTLNLWQAFRKRRQNYDDNQRLRFLTDRSDEMVLAFDMERRLIYANAALERLTGYSVGELEAEQFIWWVAPRDRERMLRLWEGLFEGNSFEDVEYRMITKDGGSKWASASWEPIRDESGRQTGVQGREREITEQKEMEEALRRSEERLSWVVESIAEWVWEVDRDGRITYTNSAIELITGRSQESVVGRSFLELMHEEDRREAVRRLPEHLRNREGWKSWLLRYHGKAGEVRYLQTSAAPIFDGSGELTGYRGVARDITEERENEEQYRHVQKLECVGKLASSVAHDFNNLLTVINGYSDIVLRSLDRRNPNWHRVEGIRQAGAMGASLTQQLLAFSRKQPVEARPVNLNTIVGEAQRMLALVLGHDIALTTRLNPGLGEILADPGQMHQVLMNLVVNARDAMPGGGTLLIETDEVALAQGDRSDPEAAAGLFVRLTVTDTGVGIDAETRERLFEPFFTTKAAGRGTGLGLSTVHGIVRQGGGFIRVDGQPGEGSSFRVYFPRVARAIQPVVEEIPEPTRLCGSETILVVEDQQHVRELAMETLASYGYAVLGAADGTQASQLAAEHAGPIHLLLTDIGMPGENGFTLAERLKERRPEMKLLFMSGYADEVLREWAHWEADRTYLEKPFTATELAAGIREVLDRPEERRATVMVVDHDDRARRWLQEILTQAGYRVASVSNGKEALRMAGVEPPDLVVADLIMPEMDGLELIRSMGRSYPGVKLIAVSGVFGARYLRMAELLGARASLAKPLEADKVLRMVAEVLGPGIDTDAHG